MIHKALAYSISEHQVKYLEAMSKVFNINTMLLPETRYQLVESNVEISISNGYYYSGHNKFNVMNRIRLFSKNKKVVTFSHSTFGSNENIYNCVSSDRGKYFAVPSAWKNILKYPCLSPNSFEYEGHFMALYHYDKFPLSRQSETILYMPISGIKNIEEVKETLKNLMHMSIMIKVHPVIESGHASHKWNMDSIGIPFQEYLDFADEHSNIIIIHERKEAMVDAIDRCKYIIGTPPTSTLIEAAIRGKIYNEEKLIIATSGGAKIESDLINCLDKYGINITSSPRREDFAILPEHTIKEFVIGKWNQESEINNLINKIKLEE